MADRGRALAGLAPAALVTRGRSRRSGPWEWGGGSAGARVLELGCERGCRQRPRRWGLCLLTEDTPW